MKKTGMIGSRSTRGGGTTSMSRRLINIALSVILVVGLMPSMAWADTADAVDGATTSSVMEPQTVDTVTVGTASTTSTYAPWYGYYYNSESVMLYNASEIDSAAGSISSIGFHFYATSTQIKLNYMRIYVGTTSDAAYTTSAKLPSDLTLVYEDTSGTSVLNNTVSDWQTFDFNKGSFDWDGTSNIAVVVITEASNEASGTPKVYASSTSNGSVVYNKTETRGTYSTATAGSTFTGANYYAVTTRPDIQFGIETCSHEGATFVSTTAPTCTTEGYDTYHCSICGKDFQTNIVEALGHDYTGVEEYACDKDGTANAEGKYLGKACTRGDYVSVRINPVYAWLWDGESADSDLSTWNGSGTEENPYLIEQASQWAGLAAFVNASSSNTCAGKYFKLTTDLDMTAGNLAPIGYNSTYCFAGNIDGDGHSITVNMTDSTKSYFALIGYEKGPYSGSYCLKNLVLKGSVTSTCSSTSYVGGFVGYAQGLSLTNCRNEATVSYNGSALTAYAGGLMASAAQSAVNVDKCSNTGAVNCISTASSSVYAGGLVGYVASYGALTATDSYNTGAVTASNSGSAYAGGIVGYCYYGTSSYIKKVDNVYNAGTLSSTTSVGKGGIVGYLYLSSSGTASYTAFSNCYWLDSNSTNFYGVKGNYTTYSATNCVAKTDAEMKSADFVTTLGENFQAGDPYPSLKWESPAGCPVITTQPVGATYVKDATPEALAVEASSSEGYALSYQWYKDNEAIEGATSASYTPSTADLGTSSYYCVVTAEGLETYPTTSATATVKVWSGAQAATPTITTQPVGASYGQGAVADPLSVEASVTDDGVLSYQWEVTTDAPDADMRMWKPVEGATETTYTPSTSEIGTKYYRCQVKNTLEGESVATKYSDGASIEVSGRTISNASELMDFATEVANGDTKAGYTTTLTADIDATGLVNPIIGTDAANCFKGTFDGAGHTIKVAISTSDQYVGLFGYTNGATIKNLTLEGKVASTYAPSSSYTAGDCGGLIGYGTATTIQNCANKANVTTVTTSTAAACYTGGICGYLYTGTIDGCCNAGAIDANTSAGGVVGYLFGGTMSNCYNVGSVSGASYYTGGIAGMLSGTSSYPTTYTNCYAAGKVGGTSTMGTGVAFGYGANNYATVTNVYYDSEVNGDVAGIGTLTSSCSAAVTAKTTSELQAAAADLGASFATDLYAQNGGYPVLAWQQASIPEGTPAITAQTRSQNVPTAETGLELSVTATGADTLTYQWYKDGEAIEGATSATYAADISAKGSHTYKCVVANGELTTTSADIVILAYAQAVAPAVSVDPAGPVEVKQGGAAVVLTATGTSTDAGAVITYQWQSSADGETFADISGATSAELTIPSTTLGDTYYRCVVTSTVVVPDNTATAMTDTVKATVIPLTIETAADWKAFADTVNGGDLMANKTIYLGNDLTLTTDDFAAVGTYNSYKFQGAFDGQGHTITLSDVSTSTASTAALFGYIGENGSVKNLNVEGSIATSTQYAGGIAAVNNGTIENCTNAANVKTTYSTGYAGGIAGQNYGFVKNCSNSGTVATAGSSSNYAAGIIGYNYHSVSGCSNSGTINASTTGTYSSTYAGGIVGYCTISYSQTYGNEIVNCYNTGAVNAMKSATGSSYYARACGIAGYVPYSSSSSTKNYTLKNCYSTGELSASINGSTSTTGCSTYGICYNSTYSSYASYLVYDNLYWLDGTAAAGFAATTSCTMTNCSSKTVEELKDESMVTTLNAGADPAVWSTDTGATVINDGYPILAWQYVGKKGLTGLKGDVNNNKRVNVVDAQVILDLANGKYDAGDPLAAILACWADQSATLEMVKAFADVNEDSVLDAADARATQYYAMTGTWG